ncbi:MAG: hypothetical protein RIR11_4154 [Bacteroidota bacterium]|jgi:hypothetical protein
MSDQRPTRLIMLFFTACLLFTYPILSIFDIPGMTFSLPTLYAYLFIVWGLIVGLTWWFVRVKK